MGKTGKVIAATIVFWVMFFIGGLILPIVRRLYELLFVPQGALIDLIFDIIASALGILIGVAIYDGITAGEGKKCLLVNCIIAVVVTVAFLVFACINASGWKVIVSDCCGVAAAIGCTVKAILDLKH